MRTPWFAPRLAVALALFSLAGAILTAAEDAPPAAKSDATALTRGPRPGDVQKVFILKNGQIDQIARILSVFPATITKDRDLRAIAVSAAPAVVSAIEETIKRLDTPAPPSKSVEVTGQILECWVKAREAAAAPPELKDVISQLKHTFNYSDCELAHTLFARGTDHTEFRTSSGSAPTYVLQGRIDLDTTESLTTVRFRGLDVRDSGTGAYFSGWPDVRDGQRVVLGKLGTDSGKDSILVLTAKVIN